MTTHRFAGRNGFRTPRGGVKAEPPEEKAVVTNMRVYAETWTPDDPDDRVKMVIFQCTGCAKWHWASIPRDAPDTLADPEFGFLSEADAVADMAGFLNYTRNQHPEVVVEYGRVLKVDNRKSHG